MVWDLVHALPLGGWLCWMAAQPWAVTCGKEREHLLHTASLKASMKHENKQSQQIPASVWHLSYLFSCGSAQIFGMYLGWGTKKLIIHTENLTHCCDPLSTQDLSSLVAWSTMCTWRQSLQHASWWGQKAGRAGVPCSIPRDAPACLSMWAAPRNSLSPGLLCSHHSINIWASGIPQRSGIFALRGPLGAASKILLFLLYFCSAVVSATLSHTCCAQSARKFRRLRPSLSVRCFQSGSS